MSGRRVGTPVLRQCFATAGVSMNIAGTALVMAFTACLLPQLQRPDSTIPIDDVMGSWIASTPGISLLLGNGLLPSVMSHFGRKNSNLICIVLSIMGWVCICLARNVIVILLGRTIQGVSLGMALSLGPILIAEYTTPRYRGAFLMTISLCNSIYVLFSHLFGSLFSWRTNAIISMAVTAANLPIVVFSPESPTWLAEKGKYEECKKAFRWLRGDDEEEELKDIIKAGIICNKAKTDEVRDESFATDLRSKLSQLKATVSKKEFYKPIIIMIHVYAILHWAGINYLAMYNIPIFDQVIGNKSSNAVHIAILDTQRLFSNILAVYIIKKVSRRGMFLSLTSVNILALLGIAGYVYVKSRNLFESSFLGLALLHVHMFSVAVCTLPLPYIIAGEIFPLKYKGISGGISIVTYAFHFFLSVKTFPFLFKTIGLDGAYCLYALITGYSLWISYRILPETKDRTLLDIEKDFRGEDHTLSVEDLKSAQSLMA